MIARAMVVVVVAAMMVVVVRCVEIGKILLCLLFMPTAYRAAASDESKIMF